MKILVVTYPNDLGSRTIEKNLCDFLEPVCDLQLFRFAAQDVERIDLIIDHRRNLWRRFQDTRKLRQAVKAAVRDGRTILFYNVSPALFSWGSWRNGKVYITMDWARKLFSVEAYGFGAIIAWIHRRIFQSCSGLLPMTDAMAGCLSHTYHVSATLIHRVPSLFDVDYFDPGEITSTDHIRVLYVGGDVTRKGGDLLYHAFVTRLRKQCTLTMVTNKEFAPCDGFRLCKGIRYGTPEHLELMRGHDIFVLPTHEDAGPQVIGEAAAAGLAVLTTRAALGAPHVIDNGVNGIISDTPEECLDALAELLNHPEKILQMRGASLVHMRKHFAREHIAAAYVDAMGH